MPEGVFNQMRILYLPNYKSQQRQFEKKNYNPYPVRLAAEAEWYREQGYYVDWNPDKRFPYPENYFDKIINEPENLPFFSLPKPDRVFTRAKDYTSGNYKYLPGTHMQVANGCWWGECSFCVEKGRSYEVRPLQDVISELWECKELGFREVFDDSGTFPTDSFLDKFCHQAPPLVYGCNMRMVDVDYRMMKKAGFRMLLFGLESANQYTLDLINKGVKVEDVKYIKKAEEAGLEPHVAVMFGYPWETDQDAVRTLKLVHFLLRKGYAKTAQASFFNKEDCKSNEKHRKFVRRIYDVWKSPEFWFNQLKDIRNTDDLKYLWRKIKAGLNG